MSFARAEQHVNASLRQLKAKGEDENSPLWQTTLGLQHLIRSLQQDLEEIRSDVAFGMAAYEKLQKAKPGTLKSGKRAGTKKRG